MIKYNLLCKKCELTFDSWFASSKEYDKLKKKQLINCHSCGSLKVEKNLMAPKLISKNFNHKNEKNLDYELDPYKLTEEEEVPTGEKRASPQSCSGHASLLVSRGVSREESTTPWTPSRDLWPMRSSASPA